MSSPRSSSAAASSAQGQPTPALAHPDIDSDGFAWLPEDDFVKHFAAGVDPVMARVLHAVRQPLAASTLQDEMGATTEVPSGHLAMVSHPAEVAVFIETAAKTVQAEIKWSGR
jgi:hypothetical protein